MSNCRNNHGSPWTSKNDKTLIRLYNQDKTNNQMADKLGRSEKSIKWRLSVVLDENTKKTKQKKIDVIPLEQYYQPFTTLSYPPQEHIGIAGNWWCCSCDKDVASINDIILCSFCFDVLSHKECFDITDEMDEDPHYRFKCYPCGNISDNTNNNTNNTNNTNNNMQTLQNQENKQYKQYKELTRKEIVALRVGNTIIINNDHDEESDDESETEQETMTTFKIIKKNGSDLTLRECAINGQRRGGRKSINSDLYAIYRQTTTSDSEISEKNEDNDIEILPKSVSPTNTKIKNKTTKGKRKIQSTKESKAIEPPEKKRKLTFNYDKNVINEWKLDDCISWIKSVQEKHKFSININALYDHFKTEEFDGESLTLMDVSDLKRFGITKFNVTKKILNEAKKLKYVTYE